MLAKLTAVVKIITFAADIISAVKEKRKQRQINKTKFILDPVTVGDKYLTVKGHPELIRIQTSPAGVLVTDETGSVIEDKALIMKALKQMAAK